jgi:hypothetical protein
MIELVVSRLSVVVSKTIKPKGYMP